MIEEETTEMASMPEEEMPKEETTEMKEEEVIEVDDFEFYLKAIKEFSEASTARYGSQQLRRELANLSPDLDLTYNYTTDDGTEQEMTVPMTVDFFWPKAGA